jgi:hypothetical protein
MTTIPTPQAHPPPLLPRLRHRRRQDRPRLPPHRHPRQIQSLRRRPSLRPPPGPQAPPPFPPRPRPSSTSSWPAPPAQLDLFDHKPALAKLEGKPLPPSVIAASATPSSAPTPPSSAPASSSPGTASPAPSSPRCSFNHAPAQLFFNTGFDPARPAEHGLVGHLRPRLRIAKPPRLRRLMSGPRGPRGGAANWSSGFLPPTSRRPLPQPRATRSSTSTSPAGIDAALQRDTLDPSGTQPQAPRRHRRPEIATRIASTRWPTACRPAPRS